MDTVFSLLTPEEEEDLDITGETDEVRAHGMEFLSFPIPDWQVPGSDTGLSVALEQLDRELKAGRTVALHCRQGIGRTGLVAACWLLTKGLTPEASVRLLSEARGVAIPETPEQRAWIDGQASRVAVVR